MTPTPSLLPGSESSYGPSRGPGHGRCYLKRAGPGPARRARGTGKCWHLGPGPRHRHFKLGPLSLSNFNEGGPGEPTGGSHAKSGADVPLACRYLLTTTMAMKDAATNAEGGQTHKTPHMTPVHCVAAKTGRSPWATERNAAPKSGFQIQQRNPPS
jgi:hypothetical protein